MNARDRSIISVVGLIVIALAGYFIVVQPEHHKSDQLSTQIASAQTALQQSIEQVNAGVAAEGQYKMYARQLKAITAAVPADTQIPALINQLQAAASKNKIGFQAVAVAAQAAAAATVAATPGAATTATSFPSQSLSLSFTGSYFAVANLLGTLASYVHADDKHFHATGRLLSISGVTLAPGRASSTSSTSTAASGDVTAAVTALDYAVPTALLSSSSSTATP